MYPRILLTFVAAAVLTSASQAQSQKKISEWPVAASFVSGDAVLGNSSGATKQIPYSAFMAAVATAFQPLDADLTAIAALTTTSYGRSLLTLADASAARTALGLAAAGSTSVSTNLIFAGPSSGSAAAGTFRALVLADLPPLSVSDLSDSADIASRSAANQFAGTTTILYNAGFKMQRADSSLLELVPGDGIGSDVTISFPSASGTLALTSDLTGGTVTSVAASGGSTGFSFTGGPITSAGTLTLTISNAATARTALGLAIGTDVQAYNSTLAAVAGGTYAGASSITTLGTIGTGIWNGSAIAVGYGGTGQTSFTNGQLLIGNTTGNTLSKATLTAGSGINITNGSGSITIASTVTAPTIASTTIALKGDGAGNAVAITNSNDTRVIGTSGDASATIANTTDVHVITAAFTAVRTLTLPAASSFTNGRELLIVTQGYPTITNYLKLVRGGSDTLNNSTSDTSTNLQASSATGTYITYRLISDGSSKWFLRGGWGSDSSGNFSFYNTGNVLTYYPQASFVQNANFSANVAVSADSLISFSNDNSSTTYQVHQGLAKSALPAYSDGAIETNNGVTIGTLGKLKTGWVVTAKTSNYTVTLAEKGTVFTNTGASGAVNFTLPTAVSGLQFSFYVDAAQTFTVTAGASTTIRIAGSASASAGNITTSTVGNAVRLLAISATQWVAESHEGTWTIN